MLQAVTVSQGRGVATYTDPAAAEPGRRGEWWALPSAHDGLAGIWDQQNHHEHLAWLHPSCVVQLSGETNTGSQSMSERRTEALRPIPALLTF